MTKPKTERNINWRLIFIGVAVLIIIIYMSRANAQTDTTATTPSGGASGYTGTNTSAPPTSQPAPLQTAPNYIPPPAGIPGLVLPPGLDYQKVLYKGMSGEEVRILQEIYNRYYATPNGTASLSVDGQFGSKTEAAVIRSAGKNAISIAELNAILLSGNLTNAVTETFSGWLPNSWFN